MEPPGGSATQGWMFDCGHIEGFLTIKLPLYFPHLNKEEINEIKEIHCPLLNNNFHTLILTSKNLCVYKNFSRKALMCSIGKNRMRLLGFYSRLLSLAHLWQLE